MRLQDMEGSGTGPAIAPSDGVEVPHPANWVPLLEQPMSTARKIRLICIGAGFSGLILAHKIKYDWKMDDFIDFQIYEKNSEVGGTWYENRYPGAACDVPAHSYVFPFEPNPEWTSFYARGPDIWKYMKATAIKWRLTDFVKFNAKVTDSIWDEESGKWKVKINQQGAVIEDECEVLVNGSGFLNKWSWPTIAGLHDFKGKLMHTADWDDSYDWSGKKIAVIGNGSSAIQLVPQLQKTAAKIANYVRNPTWIATNYLQDFKDDGNLFYTDEERKKFREDPEAFFQMRKKMETGFNSYFIAALRGTPEQKGLSQVVEGLMKDRLGNKPELIKEFVPNFGVGCRRLTPGDGYLEALQEPNAQTIWTPITNVTEKGILTADGEEEYDMIVTATGFDVSFRPSWNMVGLNGASLKKEWAEEPESYFGMCAANHPNYFIYTGPNSPVAHGVLTSSMDAMSAYILKWCKKIATEDIKSAKVKPKVINDLSVWSQEQLLRTIWSDECTSWYKNGKAKGKITGLHGGSVMHYRDCIGEIRGEHFDIEYRSPNMFRFLGDGLTWRDVNKKDLGYYLKRPVSPPASK